MTATLRLCFAVCSALALVSGCSQPTSSVKTKGQASDAEEVVSKSKLVGVTLMPTDLSVIATLGDRLPLLIDAPPSSEVTSGTGYIEVVKRFEYQLFVQKVPINIPQRRNSWTKLMKIHEVIADEPERYIAKVSSQYSDPAYLIIMNKKIGDTEYGVDNVIAAWKPATKEDLEVVLKSIDSLREKPTGDQQPNADNQTNEPAENGR